MHVVANDNNCRHYIITLYYYYSVYDYYDYSIRNYSDEKYAHAVANCARVMSAPRGYRGGGIRGGGGGKGIGPHITVDRTVYNLNITILTRRPKKLNNLRTIGGCGGEAHARLWSVLYCIVGGGGGGGIRLKTSVLRYVTIQTTAAVAAHEARVAATHRERERKRLINRLHWYRLKRNHILSSAYTHCSGDCKHTRCTGRTTEHAALYVSMGIGCNNNNHNDIMMTRRM